jgi:hypothetical protein
VYLSGGTLASMHETLGSIPNPAKYNKTTKRYQKLIQYNINESQNYWGN